MKLIGFTFGLVFDGHPPLTVPLTLTSYRRAHSSSWLSTIMTLSSSSEPHSACRSNRTSSPRECMPMAGKSPSGATGTTTDPTFHSHTHTHIKRALLKHSIKLTTILQHIITENKDCSLKWCLYHSWPYYLACRKTSHQKTTLNLKTRLLCVQRLYLYRFL